ncbi:MAG: 2-oxo acid dehydrogenase subunit E2 [Proteobacteria bacterium]|nr:2-oxo acid dehydrogenase subunit E2 [Pseudomonadota bacterium]
MTDIIVPSEQTEGTRFKFKGWLKAAGAQVKVDEPVAELETDKVTMEIVAPVAGALEHLPIEVGSDVTPGALIGRISSGAPKAAAAPSPVVAAVATSGAKAPPAPLAPRERAHVGSEAGPALGLSPTVRRLIAEHNVDPKNIQGTGRGGRVTHTDVLAYVQGGGAKAAPARTPAPAAKPQGTPTAGGRMIPHTNIRRAIAEHMANSVATAPHVTAVFEVDFSTIIADRKRKKAKGGADYANLTYTAYFVAACVEALQAVPVINSRWHDDAVEVFDDINIGVGTALGDEGLVVPVIHKAQMLSLNGISRQLTDLTNRARTGKLQRADVSGGTFTISNHGVSGSLLAAPIIINQPQSAILGIGKLEKRVIVREVDGQDTIQIRPMAYVSLTIDHRVIDGHQTNTFLKKWVDVIEGWTSAD